jgi:hypothetical protein
MENTLEKIKRLEQYIAVDNAAVDSVIDRALGSRDGTYPGFLLGDRRDGENPLIVKQTCYRLPK